MANDTHYECGEYFCTSLSFLKMNIWNKKGILLILFVGVTKIGKKSIDQVSFNNLLYQVTGVSPIDHRELVRD